MAKTVNNLFHQFKRLAIDLTTLLVVGVIIGATLGIVANFFIKGILYLTDLRSHAHFPVWLQNFSPVITFFIAAIVVLGIRKALDLDRWHGPPDSILASHQATNTVDIKKGFGTTLAAFVSASGGASVGQYGPLVHFGGSVGSLIQKVTSTRLPPGIFIGCGVAAAISAGFGAPIAGMVYAHEAILRHFSIKAGGAIAIASITASTVGGNLFAEASGLKVTGTPPPLLEIAPMVLAVSPLLGLAAILYCFGIRSGAKLAKASGLSLTSMLLVASLFCGTVGVFLPEVLGLGAREMSMMYAGQFDLVMLFALFLGKIVITSACLGFGYTGGIFGPALFTGAAAGGFIGQLLVTLGFDVSITAMALAGTAAVGSVAIGAPMATILIILEFTGSYEYAVTAMIAVQISNFISHRLYGDSLFDLALQDRGVKINLGRQHILMNDTPISTIVSDAALTFNGHTPASEVKANMIEKQESEAMIIDNNGYYIGKLNIHDVLSTTSDIDATAESLVPGTNLVLEANQSLVEAIDAASNFIGDYIPVKNENGKYIGCFSEADLFKAYLRIQSTVLDVEKDTTEEAAEPKGNR